MEAGRRFMGLKSPILILMLLSAVCAAPTAGAQAQTSAPSARDEMTLRMVQLARAGRLTEAREVLLSYLADQPGDSATLYNLACIDVYLNENERALMDLDRALAAGYTNFRLLDFDSDLAPLRDDPRFIEMTGRYEEQFRIEFQARSLDLQEGYATGVVPLRPAAGVVAAAGDVPPGVVLYYDSQALIVKVTAPALATAAGGPPWQGGSGVLVNLILPMSPDDYESRRYFSYGFYEAAGEPTAVLVGRDGKVELAPRSELAPEITRLADQTEYRITIPWEHFTPYAPPLDQEMGLNVFYIDASKGMSGQRFALMDEDRLSYEGATWRRYVPVYFATSDRSLPVLRGRLYQRLVQGDSVGVQLALWSNDVGDAQCRLSLRPASRPAETVGSVVSDSFPCVDDLNLYNRNLGVEALGPGSFLLRAEVTGPGGESFARDFPFDNFQPDWMSSLNERVFALKTPEQSILNYHLFALVRQAESRHPQDDASGLHAARAEVVRMIELVESGASCLPDSGLFRGGFKSDVMTQRFCLMYLPQGYRQWEAPEILMVLPPEPGTEEALARSLGQALAGRAEVVVLVPQSSGYSSLAAGRTAGLTELALDWAGSLFPTGRLTLVGLGTGTDAALEGSLNRPERCRAVVLDGDHVYSDLPDFSAAALQAALGDRRNGLPYTVTAGSLASPRLPVIIAAMKQAGLQVAVLELTGPTPDVAALAAWFLANR